MAARASPTNLPTTSTHGPAKPTARAVMTQKQRWLAGKKIQRIEEKARRQEQEIQCKRWETRMRKQKKLLQEMEHISSVMKAAQAAISVLCGYETNVNRRIKFDQFAAEVMTNDRETDMHDLWTIMCSINTGAYSTSFLPRDEIRPLLHILGGLSTSYCIYSYDDPFCGCGIFGGPSCDGYQLSTDALLNELSFRDLVGLSRYLQKFGFKKPGVSIWMSTPRGTSAPVYTDEQYISALHHAIDIIILAAKPSEQDMGQSGSFQAWVQRLKSDTSGWWATNKFVVEMNKLCLDITREDVAFAYALIG